MSNNNNNNYSNNNNNNNINNNNVYSADAVKKPKKFSIVKLILIIVCILAVICGGFLALCHFDVLPYNIEFSFGGGSGSTKNEDKDTGKVELDENTGMTPSDDEFVTLELYSKSEEDEENWDEITAEFEKRVAFVDENAEIVKSDNKMILNIKKDFAETPVSKKTLVDVLTSAGYVALGIDAYSYMDEFKDGIEEVNVMSADKSELASELEGKAGERTIEKINELSSDKVYYIKATLNSDGVEDVEDCVEYLDENDETLTIQLDANFLYAEGENSIKPDLIIAGDVVPDGEEVYIIPTDIMDSENSVNLLEYVIESEPMGSGVSYVCLDEPTWESGSEVTGEYQEEEIDGDFVIVEFTEPTGFTYTGDFTSGDLYDGVGIVKKRLDSLEVPYAVGYRDIGENSFAIKINPEEIGSDMLRMLINNGGASFKTQFQNTYLYASELVFAEDGEGNPCFKAKLSDTKAEALQDLIEKSNGALDPSLTEIPAGTILYLVVNDVTVARADMSQITDIDEYYSELCFSQWECIKDSEASEDNGFVKLVNYIASENGDYVKAPWEDIKVTYYEKGERTDLESEEIPWKYNTLTEVDDTVFETVKENGAEVHKMISKRNALLIEIDVEADENFVESFTEEVKKIYEACNFDGGAYNFIKFKAKGAGEVNPSDRADMAFEKDLYDGEMQMGSYGFYGPTYNRISYGLYDLMKADEFFSSKRGY